MIECIFLLFHCCFVFMIHGLELQFGSPPNGIQVIPGKGCGGPGSPYQVLHEYPDNEDEYPCSIITSGKTAKKKPVWRKDEDWGPCSKSCGGGLKNQTRSCYLGDEKVNTDQCQGDEVAVLQCNTMPCSQWTEWTSGKCSNLCYGRGIKEQTRECLNLENGNLTTKPLYCKGTQSDLRREVMCIGNTCPGWSTWSPCNEMGDTNRTRTCYNSTGDAVHPDEEPDLCAGDPWVSFQCPEPLECEPNYPYPVDNGLTCCATFTSDLAPECIGTKFHPNEIKGCCPVNEQRPCLKAHTDLGGSCIITTDHLVQENNKDSTLLMLIGGVTSPRKVQFIDLTGQQRDCGFAQDYPLDHGSVVGAYINGQVFACGGKQSGVYLSNCYNYNNNTDTWELVGSMGAGGSAAAGVRLSSDEFWVSGGRPDNDPITSSVIYNGQQNIFEAGPDLPWALFRHTMLRINETTVLILGHHEEGNSQNAKVLAYNRPGDEFIEVAELLTGRKSPFAGLVTLPDGSRKLVVTGGYKSTGETSSTEIIDLQLGTHIFGTNLPHKYRYGTSVQYGDTFLVVGGLKGESGPPVYSQYIYEFNPLTGGWIQRPEAPSEGVTHPAAFLVPEEIASCTIP